jgi:hypothetical protein
LWQFRSRMSISYDTTQLKYLKQDTNFENKSIILCIFTVRRNWYFMTLEEKNSV